MNSAKAAPLNDQQATTRPSVALRIITGPHQGEEFTFHSHQTLVVGRAADAQWRMAKDLFFSRYHFRIEATPPLCRLEDLNSSNGTHVNGSPVQTIELKHGDRIECGDTTFEVSVVTVPDESGVATLDVPSEERLAVAEKLRSAETKPLIRVGEFELTRELGRGGMGVVFHAIQRGTKREAAIKIIHPASVVTPDAMQLFLREASILSQLRHPRIVEYFSVGLHQGRMFLAMEYLPVIDLAELMARQSRGKQIRLACGLICRVLEALHHAHQQQIVHRDVKPQNMLVYKHNERLQVKLADFGLAKNYINAGFTSITRDDEVRGTLGFMPPEQLINCRYAKPACDIYAAGACLYYLLSRKLPYDTTDVRSTIALVLNSSPQPLTQHAPDVPTELAALVHRAMAREPEARFASAELMRQALLKFSEKQ